MDHGAQGIEPEITASARLDSRATLRVMDRAGLSAWSEKAANSALEHHSRCLLYLLPLGNPSLRSTHARRLRLKDSLAGGKASRNAGILARDPHFWDYLQQINLTAYEAEIDTRRARHFINRLCRVGGRHELDRNGEAARCFFTLIEQPFLDWLFLADSI